MLADLDQGLKRLVQTYPRDLLALVAPEAEFVDLLPGDVALAPQRVLDLLLRVRLEGVARALDLELGARPRVGIAGRLAEYGMRAYLVTGLPILSVVLWLQADGTPERSPYELRVGRRLVATWQFSGIALYAVPAEALLARGLPGLLPLVPFARGGGTEARIEEAAREVLERVPSADAAELEALLAAFGGRAIGRERMLSILRRLPMSSDIQQLIEESPVYQEWTRQAQERGMAAGLSQGRDAGRAEGVREAARQVLVARFGPLADDLERALGGAAVERLEGMLAVCATGTLGEVRACLGLTTGAAE